MVVYNCMFCPFTGYSEDVYEGHAKQTHPWIFIASTSRPPYPGPKANQPPKEVKPDVVKTERPNRKERAVNRASLTIDDNNKPDDQPETEQPKTETTAAETPKSVGRTRRENKTLAIDPPVISHRVKSVKKDKARADKTTNGKKPDLDDKIQKTDALNQDRKDKKPGAITKLQKTEKVNPPNQTGALPRRSRQVEHVDKPQARSCRKSKNLNGDLPQTPEASSNTEYLKSGLSPISNELSTSTKVAEKKNRKHLGNVNCDNNNPSQVEDRQARAKRRRGTSPVPLVSAHGGVDQVSNKENVAESDKRAKRSLSRKSSQPVNPQGKKPKSGKNISTRVKSEDNVRDSPASLRQHSEIVKSEPSQEDPNHFCQICQTSFTNLKRHQLRIHDTSSPTFKCEFCEKTFKVAYDCKRHVLSVH